MNMKKKSLPVLFLIIFSACNHSTSNEQLDTVSSGKISISVDESLQPILEAEASAFQFTYPKATIDAQYKPEQDVIADLLNKKIRFAVISRKLRSDELAALSTNGFQPEQIFIATDAISLIVNKINDDTNFRVDQLREILSGRISSWDQMNGKSTLGKLAVVFDNSKSGTVRYLKDTLNRGNPLPDFCYAQQDNPSVINYVAENKNALGVIGVNWLGDSDDTTRMIFSRRIKVAGIAGSDSAAENGDFYKPYQAYMALQNYPLTRQIYIILREARAGLGTGFATFIASDKGQTVILKSRLIPATAPLRIIQLDSSLNQLH
jgi:phosphate transport system substrate-binding protein